jgi:uncharacterized protein YjbI with pentapeptide repeats
MEIDGYDVQSIASESPYADEIILTPDNCPELKAALEEENRPLTAEMDPSESPFAEQLRELASAGRGAVFHRCIFHQATFRGMEMGGTIFERCNLMGVFFILTDLSGSEFKRCNVDGVSFNGVGLGLFIPELGITP